MNSQGTTSVAHGGGFGEEAEIWNELEALLALLALLLELGVGANAAHCTATAPVWSARPPPTISELEDALSATYMPAASTRTRRSSSVGQRYSRSTVPGVGACGNQVKHRPCSTMTADAMESIASPLWGKEQKQPWAFAGAEDDADGTTAIPAQAMSTHPTNSTGMLLAMRRPASDALPHKGHLVGRGVSSSSDNPELIRASSHGDAPLTTLSLTDEGSYRSLPSTTGIGAENSSVRSAPVVVSPLPAEFAPRIRSGLAIPPSARLGSGSGSGSRTAINTKSIPAPGGRGKVSAKDFKECGYNFAALLVVRWNSLARRREKRRYSVGTGGDVGVYSGSGGANGETGFELIVRLALRQSPPARQQWWVHPFCRWVSHRLRSPQNGEGVGGGRGKWWRARDPDRKSLYETSKSSIASGGAGMSNPIDGVDLESPIADTPGAPERRQVLATEILRDHFLTQVEYAACERLLPCGTQPYSTGGMDRQAPPCAYFEQIKL